MAAILKSAIMDSAIVHKKTSFIHSVSTWWWQPSWILPSWIQPFFTKLWLNLIQSDSNPFILTDLDDGSHLEFCHLGFRHFAQNNLHLFILTQLDDGSHFEFCHVVFSHLSFSCQTHSHLLRLVPPLAQKKTSLTLHSDSDSNSFFLTQLNDGSHLEVCHHGFSHSAQKNFIHSFCLNLMMATILNSAILDSAIFHKTLTQSNSIWLKPIHSDWPWWWQPSWILSSWIQTFCTK